MKELTELIKDYLNSWKECVYCNHMVKSRLFDSYQARCIECINKV